VETQRGSAAGKKKNNKLLGNMRLLALPAAAETINQ